MRRSLKRSLWPVGLVLLVGLALTLAPKVLAQGAGSTAKAEKASESKSREVKLRDPFRPLVSAGGRGEGDETSLPPGKRGLVIARLTINGIVAMGDGNIGVVTMRGRNRAYFLREGDEVYQGRVVRITEDAITFHETATDAFGGRFEREVVKQISGSGAQR